MDNLFKTKQSKKKHRRMLGWPQAGLCCRMRYLLAPMGPASSLCSYLLCWELLLVLFITCPMSSKSSVHISPPVRTFSNSNNHPPPEKLPQYFLCALWCPSPTSLWCFACYIVYNWLFSDTFIQVCKLWGLGFCPHLMFPAKHRVRHTIYPQVHLEWKEWR